MRKKARSALAALALGSGLFGWAACGDDDPGGPAPSAPDASREATVRDATPIFEVDADDGDSAPPEKPRGPYDAGPENFQVLDAGDGGIPCVQGGELEIEDNDSFETATPILPPSSRCGVARVVQVDALDAGADADADAGDGGSTRAESDFMTFHLSAAAKNMYVQYFGEGVEVFVRSGDAGAAQDITKPGVILPFNRNAPYYVEVRSKTGKDETWRVSVFEDR